MEVYLKILYQMGRMSTQWSHIYLLPSTLQQEQLQTHFEYVSTYMQESIEENKSFLSINISNLIKGIKDVNTWLMDGAHNCSSCVHCVPDCSHNNCSSSCI